MATHSSILAWKIPRTEEPGGLQYGEGGVIRKGGREEMVPGELAGWGVLIAL